MQKLYFQKYIQLQHKINVKIKRHFTAQNSPPGIAYIRNYFQIFSLKFYISIIDLNILEKKVSRTGRELLQAFLDHTLAC